MNVTNTTWSTVYRIKFSRRAAADPLFFLVDDGAGGPSFFSRSQTADLFFFLFTYIFDDTMDLQQKYMHT